MSWILPGAPRAIAVSSHGVVAAWGSGWLWRSDTGVERTAEPTHAVWLGETLRTTPRPMLGVDGRLFELQRASPKARGEVRELSPSTLQVIRRMPTWAMWMHGGDGHLVLGGFIAPDVRPPWRDGITVFDLDFAEVATHDDVPSQCRARVRDGRLVVSGAEVRVGPVAGPLAHLPGEGPADLLPDGDLAIGALHVARAGRLLGRFGTLAPDRVLALPGGRVVLQARATIAIASARPIRGVRAQVAHIAADGRHVAVFGKNGCAMLYTDGHPSGAVAPDRNGHVAAAWSGGRLLVARERAIWGWTPDGAVCLRWPVQLGSPVHLEAAGGQVLAVGRRVAVVLDDQTGQVVAGPWPGERFRGGALHPDGSALVFEERGEALLDGARIPVTARCGAFDGTGERLLLGAPTDGELRPWPMTGQPIRRTNPVYTAVGDRDRIWWTSGGVVGAVGRTAEDDAAWRFHDEAFAAAPGPDGGFFTQHRQWVGLRDREGTLRASIPVAVGSRPTCAACSEDGRWLAVGTWDALTVWRLDGAPHVAWVVDGSMFADPVESLAVDAVRFVGQRLLVTMREGVTEWPDVAVPDGSRVLVDAHRPSWFSADGRRGRCGGRHDPNRVIDLETGAVLFEVDPPSGGRDVWMRLSDDGRWFVAASRRRGATEVTLWSVDDGTAIATLQADADALGVAPAPDGTVVLWFDAPDDGARGPSFVRWDPHTDAISRWLPPEPDLQGGRLVAFAAGRVAMTGGATVVTGGRRRIHLPTGTVQIPAMFADRGQVLLTTDFDGWTTRWDLASGTRIDAFCRHKDGTVWVDGADGWVERPGPWAVRPA